MLSEEEARKEAEYGLRFEFGGTIPHLGKTRFSEDEQKYVFPILVSYPRLPEDEEDELTFDETRFIGEVQVDKETGTLTHTPQDILSERVGEIKHKGTVEFRKNIE